MPVETLRDMAIRVCVKNINQITSVGDLPFHAVREILEKVQRPEQLMAIEKASPQIRSDTAKIWQGMIHRDFPSDEKKKLYKPANPEKWSKVYRRYKDEHEKELAASLASLKSSMGALKAAKDEKTSKTMTKTSIRNLQSLPPVSRPRWGAGASSGWGSSGSSNTSSLNFTKGTRTKALTGSGLLKKARREASEIANIRSNLSTGALMGRSSGVTKAPPAMLNDRRVARQATYRPTPKAALSDELDESGGLSVDDIEYNYISDDDEDEDEDDVFDELPPTRKNTDTKPSYSSSQTSTQKSQGPPPGLLRKRKAPGDPFLAKKKRIN